MHYGTNERFAIWNEKVEGQDRTFLGLLVQYLKKYLLDFHQTYTNNELRDGDESVKQKSKFSVTE